MLGIPEAEVEVEVDATVLGTRRTSRVQGHNPPDYAREWGRRSDREPFQPPSMQRATATPELRLAMPPATVRTK
jgi:hypothetical protein